MPCMLSPYCLRLHVWKPCRISISLLSIFGVELSCPALLKNANY
uniref:Uncharacterized protein n=1 Tax=Arundo donax TaxID=35708 RepID=A0A0A9GSD7_ARUDO